MSRILDPVMLLDYLQGGVTTEYFKDAVDVFLEKWLKGTKHGLSEQEILEAMFIVAFTSGSVAAELCREGHFTPRELHPDEIDAACIKVSSFFQPRENGDSPS